MLSIIARTFISIIAALVFAQMIDIGRRAIRNVGIHIPHDAIAFVVGTPKGIPQLGIRDGCVTFDDIVQSPFQLIACQSIGGVVVV